jgi:hypothetical protein
MLKARPLQTNVGSAFILMGIGDVAAQKIELNQAPSPILQQPTLQRTLSFRYYNSSLPDQEEEEEEDVIETRQDIIRERLHDQWRSFNHWTRSLDFFRTCTMAVWAGGFHTPFFVSLFKVYDRYPMNVPMRVCCTFLASIPTNALFFVYGSFVQHVTNWIALIRAWKAEVKEATLVDILVDVPFDVEMIVAKTRLKLDNEFYRVMVVSAGVWIPINIVNFSLMPPHLRPLTLMVCSVFWNCYLSLAQHRDEEI